MNKRLHYVLAWLLALPLIWLALTGALLGFAAEMDRIMHVELMTTPMSQQPTLPESAQIELIRQAYPQHQWVAFTPSQNPVDTSMALLRDEQSHLWQVFLNPKLGVINGMRPLADDWKLTLTAWHKFDFLGSTVGQTIVLVASLGLLLTLLTGWIQSLTQMSKSYSLHRLLGQWMTPILLVLVISGILLGSQNAEWIQTDVNWASIHQGDWLGMPGRLLWVMASLGLAWLVMGGIWLASVHKKDY